MILKHFSLFLLSFPLSSLSSVWNSFYTLRASGLEVVTVKSSSSILFALVSFISSSNYCLNLYFPGTFCISSDSQAGGGIIWSCTGSCQVEAAISIWPFLLSLPAYCAFYLPDAMWYLTVSRLVSRTETMYNNEVTKLPTALCGCGLWLPSIGFLSVSVPEGCVSHETKDGI